MQPRSQTVALLLLILLFTTTTLAQSVHRDSVPKATLLRIVKAEDERRWDGDLRQSLTSSSSAVRLRAALAAARIGNEGALPELASILKNDKNLEVRAMAAFAIGEVESPLGATALLEALKTGETAEIRARAIEALGKIAGVLPREQQTRTAELGAAILEALKAETERPMRDRQLVLLGITALLRARTTNAGPTLALLLNDKDARVRADSANTLARLRLGDGNARLLDLLTNDADAVCRSNAARVLGATEEKRAIDKLIESSISDRDSRVRVSAIRALITLKDSRAAEPLLVRGRELSKHGLKSSPTGINEILEIAVALGRLLSLKEDRGALDWLTQVRSDLNYSAPEVELAFARISPVEYLGSFGEEPLSAKRKLQETLILHWRSGASIAQALGEIASLPTSVSNRNELARSAQLFLRAMLDYKSSDVRINSVAPLQTEYGLPDVLRAYTAHKPVDLGETLRSYLENNDVVVRATAADLLGDLPPSEQITRSLIEALPRALKDELNDAALSILDSLGKQKNASANDAVKSVLESNDYLLKRRAVAVLKANGAGDFTSKIGLVKSRNTTADYKRALARVGQRLRAVVTTTRGSFTMELLPSEAPLTVDNFVQLARRGYYRGIVFHRVVPNFVIQGGDPRGDGNGGPGYAIRCEVNDIPYDRGSVGMALSGKDTGGSQWFVTHAPQPHLDGGYTVFGKVVSGMNVVDGIIRGDIIRSISIR